MTILYRLNSIRKCYGSNVVLDIEDLTIVDGRLYTLIGANGAGKSTLLNILAFLSPPTCRGDLLRGEAGRLGSRFRGGTSQEGHAAAPVSVPLRGNGSCQCGLRPQGERDPGGGTATEPSKRRSTSWAFRDSATGRPGNCPAARRRGWRWRRALVLKPEVLLLDEPLANIDRGTTGLLETVIASLPAQGTTVVMTTHNPDHPGRLNGETIFLEGGRVVTS